MWWRLVVIGLLIQLLPRSILLADTSTSDTTLSISPSATSGTTITAADENDRNNDVSTWTAAHDHDLSNTTAFGDGAAGDKNLCADAADGTDACLRWNDTTNVWQIDQITQGTFNTVIVQSGTAAFASRAVIIGTGDLGRVEAATMTLATSLPTTFGDFAARAFNTAALSIPSGTPTILTFNDERGDTDTIHSTAANTGRLTATTAGRYQITGHIEFAADLTDGQRLVEMLLNGATVIAAEDCGYTGDVTLRAVPCSITTHYNLAATDYVELRVTQRVETNLNINASANYSPEFEMVKVP